MKGKMVMAKEGTCSCCGNYVDGKQAAYQVLRKFPKIFERIFDVKHPEDVLTRDAFRLEVTKQFSRRGIRFRASRTVWSYLYGAYLLDVSRKDLE
jgi:hypothetical protein